MAVDKLPAAVRLLAAAFEMAWQKHRNDRKHDGQLPYANARIRHGGHSSEGDSLIFAFVFAHGRLALVFVTLFDVDLRQKPSMAFGSGPCYTWCGGGRAPEAVEMCCCAECDMLENGAVHWHCTVIPHKQTHALELAGVAGLPVGALAVAAIRGIQLLCNHNQTVAALTQRMAGAAYNLLQGQLGCSIGVRWLGT